MKNPERFRENKNHSRKINNIRKFIMDITSIKKVFVISSIIFLILPCVDMPSNLYFEISRILATLTVGLGAMHLSYFNLKSNTTKQVLDMVSKTEGDIKKIDDIFNSAGFKNNPKSPYSLKRLKENRKEHSELAQVFYGLFKLFFMLTLIFGIRGYWNYSLYKPILSLIKDYLSDC